MASNKFNILFITQEDPFYIKTFFEAFCNHYEALDDIKAVVISQTMGDKTFFEFLRRMYNFYGLYDFTRMGVNYTYCKCMNALSGLFTQKKFYSMEKLCNNYNIPVIHHDNINDMTFLKSLASYDLDLIVSIAAPVIFREGIITLPRFGCINIHHALLPKYRGMMPNFWQMYHGEKTSGITIHKINPKIDDGEIILQQEVTIQTNESLDSLIKRTKRIGASLMVDAINLIKQGQLKYLPNDSSESTYYSFPTRDDVKKFKSMGNKIL